MGTVVFVFGTSYSDQSDTNSSGIFRLLPSGIFLGSALFAGRMDNLKWFKRILYAFFVASCVNAVTWYFGLYARDGLFKLMSISMTSIHGMTATKLSEVLLALGTILALVKLSGDDLDSVYF